MNNPNLNAVPKAPACRVTLSNLLAVLAVACAASATLSGCATGGTEKPATVSLSRPMDQADMLIRNMHEMLSATTRELQNARRAVHARKMVCVGEAHEIIRSTVSIADRYHIDYLERRTEGDHAGADKALLAISIAHARVDDLHGRMKGCGGMM